MGIHVILAKKQQQLCDDLLVIEDIHERLAAVVNRGRRTSTLSAAERTDATRVRGCISAVWVVGEFREGRCYFRSDADGPLVQGLVALICDFFSGATPGEIIASDLDPLVALGLLENLSPTRRHGLASARAAIKAFARGSPIGSDLKHFLFE
ncbi:MAG: SufE family protein [Opitutaceae bacterium]